ncbi:hypothetical protein CWR45_06940 [Oceanobacillus chungangensis]|uniref:Uncharacterized protein n=1 Tax=Oceanobacillus chungangensis TaxID=1229152 RepID=A0A3D8PWZ4_9BACI|nr:hypothetical protein CWR45_06940 [Oceanobacillus chungangensis]
MSNIPSQEIKETCPFTLGYADVGDAWFSRPSLIVRADVNLSYGGEGSLARSTGAGAGRG